MADVAVRATRPRNRKQQIVGAAAELFHRHGYHNVGMSDIAEVVGISGPALYRHFRGKQDLLYAVVAGSIDRINEPLAQEYDDLASMLGAISSHLLENRSAVVWNRLLRFLPSEQAAELRGRYVEGLQPLRDRIAAARDDAREETVEPALRACLAALSSMAQFSVKVPPERARALMVSTALPLCLAEFSGDEAFDPPPVRRHRLTPTTRREAVISAAIRLFAERGFTAVGMEDIGEAAGLAGPSLYHHFPSKSAILVAVLTRCLEALLFDTGAALEMSANAGEALEAMIRSFMRVNLEQGDAISTLLNDFVYVPEEERGAVRRMQQDYFAEWTALQCLLRPESPTDEARLAVHAAQSIVDSLRHGAGVWERPVAVPRTLALSRLALGVPEPA